MLQLQTQHFIPLVQSDVCACSQLKTTKRLLSGLLTSALLLCSLLQAGCTTAARVETQVEAAETLENPAQPATPTPEPEALKPLTRQQITAIDSLLVRGELALKARDLLTPISRSAFDYYEAVLSIDEANADALRGLEKIIETYLDMAINAARNSQFAEADKMMKRARIAYAGLTSHQPASASNSGSDPGSSASVAYSSDNLESVRSSIRMLRGADRQRLLIDRGALQSHDKDLSERLLAFGQQAKSPGVRVVILAPSDDDGRWIYQQLRKARGEYRIRGEIQIGIPAQVELLSIERTETSPAPSADERPQEKP